MFICLYVYLFLIFFFLLFFLQEMGTCDGLTVIVMFLAVDDDEVFFFLFLKFSPSLYLISRTNTTKKTKKDETNILDVGKKIQLNTL